MSEIQVCKVCGDSLTLKDVSRRSNRRVCQNCLNAWHRNYYRNTKVSQNVRFRKYLATINGRAKKIMSQTKHRSKKAGLKTNVTEEIIVEKLQAGVCEASGLPLNTDNILSHWENPLGPSIDRISSDKGYEIDNVQIVCNMYNRGKNKHDEIDFIAMCIAVAEINRDRPDVIERLKIMRSGRYKSKGTTHDQTDTSETPSGSSGKIRTHDHTGQPEGQSG